MVVQFQPKDAIFVDGIRITYDRIDDAFHNHQLKMCEMARLFKKYPDFHRWFLFKHRQVFA